MPALLRWVMVGSFLYGVAHYLALLGWGAISAVVLARPRPATRDDRAPLPHARGTAVSVVIPAYNEANVIVETVGCVLAQDHRDIEVIVVNDGSTDATLSCLIDAYQLVPIGSDCTSGPIRTQPIRQVYRSTVDARLVVVDKVASGAKADNSNVGINLAMHPWVVVMDADELLQPDVIRRCMFEALSAASPTVAVGATLLPSNDCVLAGSRVVAASVPSNYWVGCQLVEYATAFFLARPGMAGLGALPVVSGGFGLFSRRALLDVGGYQRGHLGEDMDMCVRLHRHHRTERMPYEIRQAPEAIVWTEFPPDRATLARQRIRWHRGLRSIIRDHGRATLDPRCGAFGWLGMGNLLLFEWIGPFIEAVGYVLLVTLLAAGWVDPWAALAMFGIAQVAGLAVSFSAVALLANRAQVYARFSDLARLFWWSVCAQFGYRQLTLFWRLRSLLPFGMHWGEMPRRGFKAAEIGVSVQERAAQSASAR